jgi:RNA polymerase sigma factor (sigma-70 family)
VGYPGRCPFATLEDWLSSPFLERVVARIAYVHGLPCDEVPDLVQETRFALWDTYAGNLNSALVSRVARNKVVDRIRLLVRDRTRDRILALSARAAADDAELHHLLNARIAELPRQLRELFVLHYRQGLSEREIARLWGVSRSTVRWLDRRCRNVVLGKSRSH